jgi:hypothetical protein
MLIKDLRFIEKTDGTDQIHGGASASTGVFVNANGGTASVGAGAEATGNSTNAGTTGNTRTASGNSYKLSAATGTAVAWGVTRDGKNSNVATSVSTGVDTDVKLF